MNPAIHVAILIVAFFAGIGSVFAVLLGQWRYLYWSERERDLRDQLRDQRLAGHDTVKSA